MTQKYKLTYQILVSHILVVCAFLLYENIILIFTKTPFNPILQSFYYAIHLLYFYFTALFFLPFVHHKFKSNLTRILLCVLQIVLYACLYKAFSIFIILILTGKANFQLTALDVAMICYRCIYFFCLALAYWFALFSIEKAKEAANADLIRLEAQESELRMETAFLRSQINPHQLFNTFTVLYSRLLDKAPEEAKTILLLSDMMEYALDPCVMSGKVKLGEDLLQIDREIRLQQVFYNGKLNIKYDSNIDELIKDVELPPLLFMNFVQNIFKHGELTNASAPAVITINNYGNVLHFRTRNKIAQSPNVPSKNTGLINTRARLEKYFPGRFELLTCRESDLFLVDLKISL